MQLFSCKYFLSILLLSVLSLSSSWSFAAKEESLTGGANAPTAQKERLRYDRTARDHLGRPLFRTDEILVSFKKTTKDADIEKLHRQIGSHTIKKSKKLNLYRIRVKEGRDVNATLQEYIQSGLIESAEPHGLRYKNAFIPNDSDFSKQWALHNTGQLVNGISGKSDADCDGPESWEVATPINRPDTLIAVIDTGVDYNHPELAGQIWINTLEIPKNGIDDDQNGYRDDTMGWDFAGNSGYTEDADPMDKDGHGTHVAGIMGAKRNNALGIAGVTEKIKIMILKVQGDNRQSIEVYDIIEAIDYAIQMGARIVNCSFGGHYYYKLEYQAFRRLRDVGILAVCSAGNDKDNTDTGDTNYPSAYDLDNIISVGASNQSDQLASFSNYGKTTVDLVAPGDNIYSTHLNNQYIFMRGTSMAAPLVSGIAGMILTQKSYLSYQKVKNVLISTVDPIASLADKILSGGRINAHAALLKLPPRGDLTGDSLVDLKDAIVALQILTRQQPSALDPDFLTADTDVNGDGHVGLADALFVVQYIAHLRN